MRNTAAIVVARSYAGSEIRSWVRSKRSPLFSPRPIRSQVNTHLAIVRKCILADLRKGIKCLSNVDGEDEDGEVFLERHFVGHGRMVEKQSWNNFTF